MNIFGTIINLEDFLHNKESKIYIQTNNGNSEVKVLAANREYNIPSFQRELRWEKQQLIELIRDLSKNSVFLGNIILKQSNGNCYDIIDGQQRITVLLMILDFIRSRYQEEIDIFEQCTLKIENFPSFSKLRENHYSLDGLSNDQVKEIKNLDYYRQIDSYCSIYEEITQCQIIDNKEKASSFLQNLKDSVFNVIVSNDSSSRKGIQYFLDVNLKGVQLDDEDIFASYLYSHDSGDEIKEIWKRSKQLNFQFNEGAGKKKYEIVDMIQHFLYCDLYLDPKYKNIEFNKKFLLKRNVEIDGSIHYEGTHIIRAINNIAYFKNMLKRLNSILEILIDIKSNPSGVSPKLKVILTEAGISNIQHNIINSYISSILKDHTMLITNAFIFKYFLEIRDANDSDKKKIAESIYSIVMYCDLLALSKIRKSTDLITSILKEKNMQSKLFNKIKDMTSYEWLMENIIRTQFKINDDEGDDPQQYKAKILASIYNFFQIKNEKVVIRGGRYSELSDYLRSENDFSIEHFLINNSGDYIVRFNGKEITCSYPQNIALLKDDVFNFIFVPKTMNEGLLKNNFISEKIKLLKSRLSDIKCDYTKMYLEVAESAIKNYLEGLTQDDDVERQVAAKFIFDFEQKDYQLLKQKVIKNFIEKIYDK